MFYLKPGKKLLLIFLIGIALFHTPLFSQEVPQSVSNTGIYDYLDELANIHIVTINSAVKPYSRLYIAQRLKEAEDKREQLNKRQMKELDFYLLDFGKELGEEWRNGETAKRRKRGWAQRRNGTTAQR